MTAERSSHIADSELVRHLASQLTSSLLYKRSIFLFSLSVSLSFSHVYLYFLLLLCNCYHFISSFACLKTRWNSMTNIYYRDTLRNLAIKKPIVSELQSLVAIRDKRLGSNRCTRRQFAADNDEWARPHPPKWGVWHQKANIKKKPETNQTIKQHASS